MYFHKSPTVRADILGHFPDILGQRQFQATWYHIFQVACHIRKCFKRLWLEQGSESWVSRKEQGKTNMPYQIGMARPLSTLAAVPPTPSRPGRTRSPGRPPPPSPRSKLPRSLPERLRFSFFVGIIYSPTIFFYHTYHVKIIFILLIKFQFKKRPEE